MSLREKLERSFSPAVKARGAAYAHTGAVDVTTATPTRLDARVRGGDRYAVTLALDGATLAMRCSCPYAAGGEPCKHLWATVLVADARGLLTAATARPRLRVQFDEVDDDAFDAEPEELADDDAVPAARGAPRALAGVSPPPRATPPRAQRASWRAQLDQLARAARRAQPGPAWSSGREIFYVVDVPLTQANDALVVETAVRERKANGAWSALRATGLGPAEYALLADPDDQRIVALLRGASGARGLPLTTGYGYAAPSRVRLDAPLAATLIPQMAATGRLRLRRVEHEAEPATLAWDGAAGAYTLRLALARANDRGPYVLAGELRRGDARRAVTEPVLLTAGGLVFDAAAVAPLEDGGAFAWVPLLRRAGPIEVPAGALDELLAKLFAQPALPPLDLPDALAVREEAGRPAPGVRLAKPARNPYAPPVDALRLRASVAFDYGAGDEPVAHDDPRAAVFRASDRTLVRRDRAAEARALERLAALRFRWERASWGPHAGVAYLSLAPKDLGAAAHALVADGWRVEAEGRLYRAAGEVHVAARSGVDWFELDAQVDYGEGVARAARRGAPPDLGAHDVVLATYGTLRRDIAALKDVRFDYAILDEAQAIKNAATASAKAARLLRATHRLALSGTPIENHLGELWSLFEFLNPGMLGGSSAFEALQSGPPEHQAEARALLARALRPFILRRTKAQVAPELPARTEQTLWCTLEPAQRRLYDQLRAHYHRALLARVDAEGLGRAKIHVLEALLRLRQAACHVGLIDTHRDDAPSAKLDVLVPRLVQVAAEGGKALVFSQFTQLLARVRARLDDAKLAYEYLDGATRDREARVARFQTDAACPVFLISLKAGGLGLNLTAADTVFLLDPWWNPAVEAQAIDRAHRIGQARRVFAYRLIARDTVEEKVLALQQTKRDLADAILSADNSLLRDLRREDLELLLG